MSPELEEFIRNKMLEWIKDNDFDSTKENAGKELKEATQPLLKDWILEAIGKGIA